jgi:hypothetical protein
MSWSRLGGWRAPPREPEDFKRRGWERRRSYNPEWFRKLYCTTMEYKIIWFYKDRCRWGMSCSRERCTFAHIEERKYKKKVCTREDLKHDSWWRIEKRCRWGDYCQVWRCVFLHVQGDGDHWPEVERKRKEQKNRDGKAELKMEDEAREQDEEVVKRRIREKIRKGTQTKAAETLLKNNEEKERILKERAELEERKGLDYELDSKRKDMKKFENRLKKIKGLRKAEEKKLEAVETERRKDLRGLQGSGRDLPEEESDERRERKKRQKKAEDDVKEKKKREKKKREEEVKQQEARRSAGSDKEWELREMPKKYEREVRKHKEMKERSLRKMSRGMVLSPELRRMHSTIIDEAKMGIAYNQMKKAEAEDKLVEYEREMKAECRKKVMNANMHQGTEEVMNPVGEMVSEGATNERRSISIWDEGEEEGGELVEEAEEAEGDEVGGEEMETDEEEVRRPEVGDRLVEMMVGMENGGTVGGEGVDGEERRVRLVVDATDE